MKCWSKIIASASKRSSFRLARKLNLKKIVQTCAVLLVIAIPANFIITNHNIQPTNAAITASTITPNSGPTAGGTSTTITGTGFLSDVLSSGEYVTQMAGGYFHSLAL
ncbi:MAG: IPT/TIG domain-containing protein, partial [Candidatus Nomurabacteria bacterium]|nr:IPT/TIG domain-containing protein [Candidatus Nomurabacteria bacterium]